MKGIRMKVRYLNLSLLMVMVLFACDAKERVKGPQAGVQHKDKVTQASAAAGHTVKVEEVIQANSYTYLRVTEGNKEFWIATAKQPIEKGMTLSFDQGLEMPDFESKELNRTFDSIWFVGQMRGAPQGSSISDGAVSPYGSEKKAKSSGVNVEKFTGGVSVEDLFSDMASYGNTTVSIRGEVSKFNSGIMGRNWVHLQDGTSAGKYFDLTVTTLETVKPGDIVIFSGKIILDKDFGAGYTYDLIMEEAVLINEG